MPNGRRVRTAAGATALALLTAGCTTGDDAQSRSPGTGGGPSRPEDSKIKMFIGGEVGDPYSELAAASGRYRSDLTRRAPEGDRCTSTTINHPVGTAQEKQLRAMTRGEGIPRLDDPADRDQQMLDRVVGHVCSPDGSLTVLLTAQGRYLLVGDVMQAEPQPGAADPQRPFGDDAQRNHVQLQKPIVAAHRILNRDGTKLVGVRGIGGDGGQFHFPANMPALGDQALGSAERTRAIQDVVDGRDVTAIAVGVNGRAMMLFVNPVRKVPARSSIDVPQPSGRQDVVKVFDPTDADSLAELRDLESALDAARQLSADRDAGRPASTESNYVLTN
jgi:hypothetical protein